jgi:hypothetical protein
LPLWELPPAYFGRDIFITREKLYEYLDADLVELLEDIDEMMSGGLGRILDSGTNPSPILPIHADYYYYNAVNWEFFLNEPPVLLHEDDKEKWNSFLNEIQHSCPNFMA